MRVTSTTSNATGPYFGPSTSVICSTIPHLGTAAIFFYLSSRRQPTSAPSCFPTTAGLPQALRRLPPLSGPSCFSLSNHVFFKHYHLCRSHHLRHRGTWRSTYHSKALPLLKSTPSCAHRILHIKATIYNSTISRIYLAHVQHSFSGIPYTLFYRVLFSIWGAIASIFESPWEQ